MNIPGKLLSFLKKEDEFTIATHINPDGDALGSSLALSMALESMGKKTTVFDKDPVPGFYRFLPGNERFSNCLEGNIRNLILLDCNHPERAGIETAGFSCSVVVDHHQTEKEFGDIKWIRPDAPATGLMVYLIIKALDLAITRDIATNLYTAIAVDTGTFRYSNTNAEVLGVASSLVDAGAEPGVVSENLHETWTEGRFKLLICAMNTLEIIDDIAVMTVAREMYGKTGTGAEDTENFTNFPRMIKGIRVSVLFREIEADYWKVSLRSRGDIDVAKVAELFNGGGHKNAAGCRIKAVLETAKKMLIDKIRNPHAL